VPLVLVAMYMGSADTTPEFGKWAQRRLLESSGRSLQAAEPKVYGALQECLDRLLEDVKPVRMLDAGCGKKRPVPIARERYVVGLDISGSQLEKNSALDEGILGDVQTYPLEPEDFDAVVCWNVLEHVEKPRLALRNFERALKPGGVLVMAVPHVRSIKGVVTRYTPFWFHKLAWRRLFGVEPSFEPFPTVMSGDIAPPQLEAFAHESGLVVEFFTMYESWQQKSLRGRLGLGDRAFRLVRNAVKLLSFGVITADATDVLVVMSKPCPRVIVDSGLSR
jgi:SAM-dependent methyltransferase